MTVRSKQNLVDLYPLTPLQQGILYHAVASERDDPYLVRICFRIDGAVDAAALRRAWQLVVDRHDALRADVEWVKSKQPIQMVFRNCPVELDEVDWTGVAPDQLAAALRARVTDEAARFSLQRAADPRIVLIRATAERSFLVWVFHHVLLDGWSVANVLAEVLIAYRAELLGQSPELVPAPPYAGYLAWSRAQPAAPAEDYWRAQLAGYDPPAFPPPLPAGAPAQREFAERSLVFSDDETAALRALASRAQVTLSACFQAAHALVVRAYTGRDDVVFGATVAGRPAELPGATAMVGAFINTVPVRVRARGGDRVGAWLASVHLEAGRRQPFEHLGLPRIQELAAAPAPLFESILVFENFPVTRVLEQTDALPFAVEPHRVFGEDGGAMIGRGRNNYPVTFVALPGRRIELVIAYHRDRVTDAIASAMLDRFAAMLRALAASSETAPLASLESLTPRSAGATAPESRAIHDRIAHWARTTPRALAVASERVRLSYAELESLANRVAHQLRERGVTPGARVGLCLPRGADFVVALYAALKCGAAYVPIDPAHPRARLGGLVDDARLAALITDRAHAGALAGLGAVICCDELPPGERPRTHAAVHPESPAYLIYTSGSTGQPKAVVVSHRALDNYVAGICERFAIPSGASMAMISTVAADLGHTTLFGALCTGGALHLISDERAADPDGFADYMTQNRVGWLKIVPGQLWGLMQIAAPDRALPSHTLVIGGEAAPRPLLAYLRTQTRCRVINHYGPTETTVGILTHELVGSAPSDAALPLGHPLPHSRAHVLGADLQPSPPGAIGEIFLGGRGLAAGYFARAALTAERFVPDPWSSEPGARLYRTGDRGRVRDDGAIEFLGRVDDQIKLRGYRIELGEIRAELLRLPGVDDARAVVRPGPAGAPQLRAYVVGKPSATPLEALLRDRLPEPMIPSVIVWLERFPVTANGKVDLGKLPEPGEVASAAAAIAPAVREPTSEAERALGAIWIEILGCERAGLDDNFFFLGGDSILALKVVARARRAGWKLTPKQLFAHPTLEAAARVAQRLDTAAAPAAPASIAPPTPTSALAGLTPIQRRFLARQTIEPHHYNQSVLLALRAPIALEPLERALYQLTEHHAALRLRFHRDGDRWSHRYADPDPRAKDLVVRVDLTAAPDAATAIERTCSELQRGFALDRGPLLRAAYLELGGARGARLLLFAHHLVVDGVSWRILLEDLAELVTVTAGLPPPTTAFRDWTDKLDRFAHSPALRDEAAYWQRAITDDLAPPPAASGSNTVGDAAIVSAALDARATAALLSRAPRAYGTHVDDLLLAALTTVMCRAWQRPGIDVTVEGHGREDLFDGVDLSRTVGWFSTLYPVRFLPPTGGDRGAVIRATQLALRAVPQGGIGYGLLRHAAGAPDPLAGAREPRITFNYLGQFDQVFARQPMFEVASESAGARRSPHTPRDSWFVVNAIVYDGTLRVDWEYSRALHDSRAVERLLADYLEELGAVIAHCESVLDTPPLP